MANPNAPDGINVSFRHGAALLEGSVQVFPGTRAVVLILPDGTAGRLAPDASFLESAMNRAGFATLTFGALTASEEAQDAVTSGIGLTSICWWGGPWPPSTS